MSTKFLVGKPEGMRRIETLRCRREDNIRMHLRETGTGFVWLRKGTGSRLLPTRQWTLGFHKRWEIYWL